jgi:hypothetical protein
MTEHIPSKYEDSNATTTIQLPGPSGQPTGGSSAKKPTELTISVTPTGPAKTVENNETKETNLEVPVTISGRLTSEGSGVAGVEISIRGYQIAQGGSRQGTPVTDGSGHYSVVHDLSYEKGQKTERIEASARSFPRPGYEGSNATTTIQLPGPNGQPTGGNVAQGTQKSSITGNAVQGATNTGLGSAKKRTELTISATPWPAKTTIASSILGVKFSKSNFGGGTPQEIKSIGTILSCKRK